MKKALLIFTLTLSVMFSSSSYAKWTKESTGKADGSTHYVDYDSVRKEGGYVYYWTLSSYLEPLDIGALSMKRHAQADCKASRFKPLSFTFYPEHMGQGVPLGTADTPEDDWTYPSPQTVSKQMLDKLCRFTEDDPKTTQSQGENRSHVNVDRDALPLWGYANFEGQYLCDKVTYLDGSGSSKVINITSQSATLKDPAEQSSDSYQQVSASKRSRTYKALRDGDVEAWDYRDLSPEVLFVTMVIDSMRDETGAATINNNKIQFTAITAFIDLDHQIMTKTGYCHRIK